ncbi:MAG: prolyl oligopeptidase family serine peptidase [Chitinophagaceae bacterium]
MRRLLLIISSSCFSFSLSFCQATITKGDYARAVSFLWQNLNNKKVYNLHIEPSWHADSSGFSFSTQSREGKIFYNYNLRKNAIEPLFDQVRLAKLLSELFNTTIDSKDLPVSGIEKIGKDQWQFDVRGKKYTMSSVSYNLQLKPTPVENPMEAKSPDGKWVAYTKEYNLFIKSTEPGGIVKQLSSGGFKNYEYATYYGWGDIMEGEGVNRISRFGVNWSPDSKYIQTYICDLRSGNKMYLLDWSIENRYRPKLLSYFRASPGDTNMVYMVPVFFDIERGTEIRKEAMRSTHTNPISYEWSEKEAGIIYEENTVRGYQRIELFSYDVAKNFQEPIYVETSTTNIDGYQSWIKAGWGKVIIASEKDGWRQLYVLDIKDKSIKPITNGNYYVNNILYVDDKKRFIVFTASGKEQGRNPYYYHAYKINVDGSGLQLLTSENANHEVSVARDGKYLVDNFSAPNQPTKTVIREMSTGKIINTIGSAGIDDLLSMNFRFTETFSATGRDGVTTIYGAIWKPTNFDSTKKYPVIDQSYTGPHTNMFPRSFTATLARSNQALAELGFIVVTVDGLGSAGRSKAFHNFSYKNMGKNLTDHMLAIKELGKKYSWIDIDRVGIFGHSAGGYDAGHALLEFPDFYKVGVASSADHDFRMEKDWWPEMYMGWPVDSTYHEVSNITMAGNLKGKLLITHGGIDENVNPSATFKLAEALIKADKQFDMLIFPSEHHGYTGKANDYFLKRRWNYFIQYLLGAEPIWDFSLH